MTDPQDVHSEEALLGAALLSPATTKGIQLDAEDFYKAKHGLIWSAAVKCAMNGGADAITVAAELERRKQLGEIGGRDRLLALAASVPAPGNAKAYAKRVKETAELRHFRRIAQTLLAAVEDEAKDDIARALDELGQRVIYVDTSSGEMVETCPSCVANERIVSEKERRIRGLELALSNKRDDRAEKAQRDPLYKEALAIFDWWRIACNHPDVSFTYEEFEQLAPHLRRAPKKDAHYRCLEAIAGAAFNPYEVEMKNGRTDRKNDWELIFRNRGKLRSFRHRAPENWQRWLLSWIEAQFR